MKLYIISIQCVFIGFLATVCEGVEDNENDTKNDMVLPEIIGDKFLYFGYGSNLLAKRIHIQNKSAVRRDIGKIQNYDLDFYTNSSRWQGAPATIVPKEGKYVWGAIWEINLANMEDLDRQESVPDGVYIPLSLSVEVPSGQTLMCRAYQLKNLPADRVPNEDVPYDRQPSSTYLKTIVKGAIESGLPDEYVEFLKSFKTNGNIVDSIEQDLEL